MKRIARSNEPRPAPLASRASVDSGMRRAGWRRFGSRRAGSRGQVLVIFAGAAFILFALMALVIDVSWYWVNTLKVQRAADAAALAGVVWLPADPVTARSVAAVAAGQNGYALTSACVVGTDKPSAVPGLCANPDTNNDRRLNVTISAPVGTFFMRIIGISTITATRDSHAEFVLPVPMGSPENYYGVFGDVRNATFTTTADTGWDPPTLALPADSNNTWTTPSVLQNKTVSNGVFSTSTTTNGSPQRWRTFDWTSGTPVIPVGATITGMQARLTGALGGSGGTAANCTIGVAFSWNGGSNFSSTQNSAGLTITNTQLPDIGLSTSTSAWGGHTWVQGDFSNTNFRVRLTWNRGGCASSRTAAVDVLTLRVTWSTTTTSPVTNPLSGPGAGCANGRSDCFQATGGQVLNARGFWGTMNTQGAANLNGDAHQPYYDNPTSAAAPACPSLGKACYDPDNYYNYAIEMLPNTTGGKVYIFDPVFCDTQTDKGTGDRWFGGSTGVSSYYELYGTNNSLFDITDDGAAIATSGGTFANIAASDSTMGGSGGSECKQQVGLYNDGRDYHDSWYLLNPNPATWLSGGPNGTVYRLHTTGTNPSAITPAQRLAAAQADANGEQSFAIYATDDQAPTTYPYVYGLGAMQMFTPLSASGSPTSSEFYLAKVPAAHAGKTMEISLWDPGDTSPLSANLQILLPSTTVGTWTATNFTYFAKVGTTNGGANAACNSNKSPTGSTVSSVQTSTGASLGLFNGCWLTIDVQIPANYAAPQQGWWKIKYNMNGTGTSNDVTTWTAQIKGNPVHLVLP